MSLQNLLDIDQLEVHETNAAQIGDLFEAAKRALDDSNNESISNETRLDAGYRAITNLCMIALYANGYRTSTSRPGHHQTMIQSLVHSIGLDRDSMLVLDTFRTKRHAINYGGREVDLRSVTDCSEATANLFASVETWLENNRPDLVA